MSRSHFILVGSALAILVGAVSMSQQISHAARSEQHQAASNVAVDGLVEVGTTKDACGGSNSVSFQGKDGKVTVNASDSKLVELPAFTRELHFYCGGSRERCANDQPFNFIKCERAGNGAIQWVFYAKR